MFSCELPLFASNVKPPRLTRITFLFSLSRVHSFALYPALIYHYSSCSSAALSDVMLVQGRKVEQAGDGKRDQQAIKKLPFLYLTTSVDVETGFVEHAYRRPVDLARRSAMLSGLRTTTSFSLSMSDQPIDNNADVQMEDDDDLFGEEADGVVDETPLDQAK